MRLSLLLCCHSLARLLAAASTSPRVVSTDEPTQPPLPAERRSGPPPPPLLTVFAGLVAVACGAGGASEVVIYSGRSQNLIQPLLSASRRRPVSASAFATANSSDLALLLEEEGDKTPADVFLSQSPGAFGFLAERGRLAPLAERRPRARPCQSQRALGGRSRAASGCSSTIPARSPPPTSQYRSSISPRSPGWAGWRSRPATARFRTSSRSSASKSADEAALAWLQALVDGNAPVYGNNHGHRPGGRSWRDRDGAGEPLLQLPPQGGGPLAQPSENHLFADGDSGAVTIATAAGVLRSGDQAVGRPADRVPPFR